MILFMEEGPQLMWNFVRFGEAQPFQTSGQFDSHFPTNLFIRAGRVVYQVQGISQGPVLAAGGYFLRNSDSVTQG